MRLCDATFAWILEDESLSRGYGVVFEKSMKTGWFK